MRWLPILFLGCIGCGGPAPIAPGADGQGAARVLVLARDLEVGGKTKQAIAAYDQIIFHFPDSPEASEAARRISEARRAAIRKVAARKSR